MVQVTSRLPPAYWAWALQASAPHSLRGTRSQSPAHPRELQLYQKPLQATPVPEAHVVTSMFQVTLPAPHGHRGRQAPRGQ